MSTEKCDLPVVIYVDVKQQFDVKGVRKTTKISSLKLQLKATWNGTEVVSLSTPKLADLYRITEVSKVSFVVDGSGQVEVDIKNRNLPSLNTDDTAVKAEYWRKFIDILKEEITAYVISMTTVHVDIAALKITENVDGTYDIVEKEASMDIPIQGEICEKTEASPLKIEEITESTPETIIIPSIEYTPTSGQLEQKKQKLKDGDDDDDDDDDDEPVDLSFLNDDAVMYDNDVINPTSRGFNDKPRKRGARNTHYTGPMTNLKIMVAENSETLMASHGFAHDTYIFRFRTGTKGKRDIRVLPLSPPIHLSSIHAVGVLFNEEAPFFIVGNENGKLYLNPSQMTSIGEQMERAVNMVVRILSGKENINVRLDLAIHVPFLDDESRVFFINMVRKDFLDKISAALEPSRSWRDTIRYYEQFISLSPTHVNEKITDMELFGVDLTPKSVKETDLKSYEITWHN
jgi:hypothetical protein